ncbi:aldo/keto reductase/Endoribonuclease L-PSP [Metarhizium guizhouense ARSEF 977]|uniref:Aldo/keto reductase/Endoribonuclease L-PSP n=1 Tax=Metarhizium guizhouense (strain ARSEF 977) TaxID=1276136 RepID=A0A0B4IBL7_METGA|nr:aldo/keto reductase/Endoribonuclease L-PSP [Metarhizium guizhouense ARSEF 977]
MDKASLAQRAHKAKAKQCRPPTSVRLSGRSSPKAPGSRNSSSNTPVRASKKHRPSSQRPPSCFQPTTHAPQNASSILPSRDACSRRSSPANPSPSMSPLCSSSSTIKCLTCPPISLTHFVDSIIQARASWTAQSPLSQNVDKFAGDTVQAMQALKESAPEKSTKLKEDLQALLASFASCQTYCASSRLEYPFGRAERQARDTLQLFFADAAAIQQASSTHGDRIIHLASPPAGAVEKFTLGNRRLPRLFNGLWQLSSPAFGVGNWHQQQRKLVKLVEAGLGDAELVYGDFRNRLPAATQAELYAATKWCVFKPLNTPVTTECVLAAVRERCRRLGGRVDLLQFHWYDYEAKEYLQILHELIGITKSHPEYLSAVGLCNFDAEHTDEICRYLMDKTGEVGIVSNQVQVRPCTYYRRPFPFHLQENGPADRAVLAHRHPPPDGHDASLRAVQPQTPHLRLPGAFLSSLQKQQGNVPHKKTKPRQKQRAANVLPSPPKKCGGLLTEKWLNQPPPDIYSPSNPLNPSQRKYLDMINHWGTWQEFQSLLGTLSLLATKYNVSIADVASRWVLQQPSVGAVLVGTRLGVSDRCADALHVFGWNLSNADIMAIDAFAHGNNGEKLHAVYQKIGDCGQEYRGMRA